MSSGLNVYLFNTLAGKVAYLSVRLCTYMYSIYDMLYAIYYRNTRYETLTTHEVNLFSCECD